MRVSLSVSVSVSSFLSCAVLLPCCHGLRILDRVGSGFISRISVLRVGTVSFCSVRIFYFGSPKSLYEQAVFSSFFTGDNKNEAGSMVDSPSDATALEYSVDASKLHLGLFVFLFVS